MKKKINLYVLAAMIGLVGFLVYGAVMYTQAMGNGSSFGGNGHSSPTAEMPSYFQGSATAEHPFLDQTGEVSGLTASTSPLMQVEIDALLYMREEEKLARDVYNVLYAQWGIPVFQNIAASEQTHMDAVKAVMDTYGLSDPASATAGEFTNQALQDLYDQLAAKGSLSSADAMLVGGAIEEIDIQDLRERLAETTHADIVQVFNNLLSGSIHHLSAFSAQYLSITGSAYVPQYMSFDDFNSLMASETQSGTQGQGYRGGRGR